MDNMYINISEGSVTNITNNKNRDDVIHLGVKYVVGRDYVVFKVEDEHLFVERFKADILLYRYEFMAEGDYMITPLFVDTYKSAHPIARELYSYLKSNLHDKFYLEENRESQEPYTIIFKSWIDRKFCYKYNVVINPEIMTEQEILDIKTYLRRMESMNLLAVHETTKGKSIYLTAKALELIETTCVYKVDAMV